MPAIRKALITEFGDESKIVVVDDQIADPAAGEVRVRVEYSGFSGADINMRRGVYPFQKKAPLTPGNCLSLEDTQAAHRDWGKGSGMGSVVIQIGK